MGKYCREHIGKTFNDGKLVVIDGGGRNGYVKVKCLVCAEDEELHGNAEYTTTVGNIKMGKLPCGCSSRVLWTLPQYKVLIERKIKEESLPIEFISFGTTGKPLRLTSLEFLCKNSKLRYEVHSINSFMMGRGNQGKFWSAEDREDRITIFNRDNPDVTIWDSGARSDSNVVFGYYCRVCEEKGFESLYTIRSNGLFRVGGNPKPCLCSITPSFIPDEHRIDQVKSLLHKSQVQHSEVIGIVHTLQRVKIVFICKYHGVYSRRYNSLKTMDCHCVKCNPPKYGYDATKKGYLYLLEIQTLHETILGYGITNTLSNRLATHKRNLASLGATISSTQVYEGSGSAVQSVENSIKALHKTGLLDCEGFRRESLSIKRKQEVLELCKDLKLKA